MDPNYLKNTTALGLSTLLAQHRAPKPQALTAMGLTPGSTGMPDGVTTFWKIAAPISIAASAYHGYKRNHGSVGWGIGWGLLGGLFPVLTPAIAVAEGFGKPK